MTRLIDAEALVYDFGEIDNGAQKRFDLFITNEVIAEQPTIDAVPVIRCEDCKYYDGYYCHNKYWGDGYGNYPPPIKADDGFCDWAERKEG